MSCRCVVPFRVGVFGGGGGGGVRENERERERERERGRGVVMLLLSCRCLVPFRVVVLGACSVTRPRFHGEGGHGRDVCWSSIVRWGPRSVRS